MHLRAAARVAETPISLARVAYWQGRTAEAVGAEEVAQRHYERAAAYPITYYGQLARAKLGNGLVLRAVPDPGEGGRDSFARLTAARALRLLYGLGVPDLALALNIDLSQRLNDAGQLEALGDLAAEHRDAARPPHGRQVGGAARLPARYARLSDDRHPELRAGRRARRQGHGLRRRPPGERVRPEGAVAAPARAA